MFLLKKCCSKNLIKKLAKKYCPKKPHPKILVLKSCHNNFVKKTSKNLVKKILSENLAASSAKVLRI